MDNQFFVEAQQVRDELSKTIQNMVPLSGPDWQEWNKARRVKIRTDIESLLIMYDQAIYALQQQNKIEETKHIYRNKLNFDNE